jgi:hypothetical protein
MAKLTDNQGSCSLFFALRTYQCVRSSFPHSSSFALSSCLKLSTESVIMCYISQMNSLCALKDSSVLLRPTDDIAPSSKPARSSLLHRPPSRDFLPSKLSNRPPSIYRPPTPSPVSSPLLPSIPSLFLPRSPSPKGLIFSSEAPHVQNTDTSASQGLR